MGLGLEVWSSSTLLSHTSMSAKRVQFGAKWGHPSIGQRKLCEGSLYKCASVLYLQTSAIQTVWSGLAAHWCLLSNIFPLTVCYICLGKCVFVFYSTELTTTMFPNVVVLVWTGVRGQSVRKRRAPYNPYISRIEEEE